MPSSTLCVAAVPARRYVPATRAAIGLSGGRGDPGWAAERPRRHPHGGPWERVVATTYGVNGICCPPWECRPRRSASPRDRPGVTCLHPAPSSAFRAAAVIGVGPWGGQKGIPTGDRGNEL